MALKITPTSATLKVGDTVQLSASPPPTGIKWKSSDEAIALVTKTGHVTARSAGSAIVGAARGKDKAESVITVQASEPASPPAPSQPSAGQEVVDARGSTWTISADRKLLQDGKHVADGYGTVLLRFNNSLYTLGLDGHWWRWTGSNWTHVGPVKPGTSA